MNCALLLTNGCNLKKNKLVRDTVDTKHSFQKITSYIMDALHSGGKQMLCDIIKWTVIIIIAAVVFTIAYKIATNQDIFEQQYQCRQR
jgi:uncharacterized membrane protein